MDITEEQYLLYLMMPTNYPVIKPKKAKASGRNYYIQSYMLQLFLSFNRYLLHVSAQYNVNSMVQNFISNLSIHF